MNLSISEIARTLRDLKSLDSISSSTSLENTTHDAVLITDNQAMKGGTYTSISRIHTYVKGPTQHEAGKSKNIQKQIILTGKIDQSQIRTSCVVPPLNITNDGFEKPENDASCATDTISHDDLNKGTVIIDPAEKIECENDYVDTDDLEIEVRNDSKETTTSNKKALCCNENDMLSKGTEKNIDLNKLEEDKYGDDKKGFFCGDDNHAVAVSTTTNGPTSRNIITTTRSTNEDTRSLKNVIDSESKSLRDDLDEALCSMSESDIVQIKSMMSEIESFEIPSFISGESSDDGFVSPKNEDVIKLNIKFDETPLMEKAIELMKTSELPALNRMAE